MERAGAKPHLRDVHSSSLATKCKVWGTDVEAFALYFELVNQEVPVDADLSTWLVSVRGAIAAAPVAAKEAKEQLASQKKL